MSDGLLEGEDATAKMCLSNNLHDLGLHMPKVFKHMAETYGPISGLYLGPQRTIVISEVGVVKELLRMPHMIGRPAVRPFHELNYGTQDGTQRGLILSTGQEWFDQRQFCIRKLRNLGFGKVSMEDALIEEVEKLSQVLEEDLGMERICQCFEIEGGRFKKNYNRIS